MKSPHLFGCLRISTMLCQAVGVILLFILGVAFAYDFETYLREKAICHLPVNYGYCRAKVDAWYYSPKHKGCRRFSYALCGGNENRFYSRNECESLCLRDW